MGNVDDGYVNVRRSVMSSSSAMSMQKKNAGTALQDSTAAADVRQIPIISTVLLTDAYDIGCEMQKKRIECAIMIKAAQRLTKRTRQEG